MLPEIIAPRKAFSCRLHEFQTLLSEVEKSCSEIGAVWSSVFRDLFAPSLGWQALWIMSEKSCMKYDFMHPTAVIVSVSNIRPYRVWPSLTFPFVNRWTITYGMIY